MERRTLRRPCREVHSVPQAHEGRPQGRHCRQTVSFFRNSFCSDPHNTQQVYASLQAQENSEQVCSQSNTLRVNWLPADHSQYFFPFLATTRLMSVQNYLIYCTFVSLYRSRFVQPLNTNCSVNSVLRLSSSIPSQMIHRLVAGLLVIDHGNRRI